MPDPAKSVGDIDDVLSSIRRLVAEQPAPARPDANGHGASDGGGEERLVLTPALRVTDPDAAKGAPSMPAPPTPTPTHDSASTQIVSAEPEFAYPTPPTDQNSPDPADAAETPSEDAEDTQSDDENAQGAAVSDAAEAEVDASEPVSDIADDTVDAADAADPIEETILVESEHASETIEEASDEQLHGGHGDTHAETDAAQAEDACSDDAELATVTEQTLDQNEPEQDTEIAENAVEPDTVTGLAEEQVSESAEARGQESTGETTPSGDETSAPAPRVVGEDGWRPEMRLFDWDASAEQADPDPTTADSTSEFESDTGDANWPDATAERAVLDLAAARVTDGEVANETADENPTVAPIGFTPIFSRRNGVAPSTVGDQVETTDTAPATDEDAVEGPDAVQEPQDADASDTQETDIENLVSETLGDAATTSLVDDMAMDSVDAATDTAEPLAEIAVLHPSSDAPVSFEADEEHGFDGTDGEDELESHGPSDDGADTADLPGRLTVLVGKGPDMDADETKAAGPTETGEADACQDDEAATGTADSVAEATSDVPLDTSILEEEVLRRIVAEAVREELQGALGERITRNVRKLVRREIRLVLAADELD